MLGTDAMDETVANDVIMAARAHWFAEGDAPPDAPAGAAAGVPGDAAAGVPGEGSADAPDANAPEQGRRRATTEAALAPPRHAEDDAPDTGPLRRCVVTRARLPKERMIRFVIGPDRAVVPDLAERLPGRGIGECGWGWDTRARDGAGDRSAAPLRRHARAAAEGTDDPLRHRSGPRGGARSGRTPAGPGNLVERGPGCGTSRAPAGRFRQSGPRPGHGAPRPSRDAAGGAGPADQ